MFITVATGRLTDDPKTGTTRPGKAFAAFTIASERPFEAEDGSRVVDYLNVVTFGQAAEFGGSHFKKGSAVIVSGDLQQDETLKRKHQLVGDRVSFQQGAPRPREEEPEVPDSETSEVDGEEYMPYTDLD